LTRHFAYFVGLTIFLAQQPVAPERKVEPSAVLSARDPNVRVRFPQSAQYVGADRWNLYDIADCELHAFVDSDAQKNVQRLYWVQFEGYLPRPMASHRKGLTRTRRAKDRNTAKPRCPLSRGLTRFALHSSLSVS
jgi:hypothetical protein